MADDFLTISDLARINDTNIMDVGASEILNGAPVLARLPAIEATHGTSHKYLKETAAPTVGFRVPNAGREMSHTGRQTVSIDLKAMDASSMIDIIVADIFPGGAEVPVGHEVLNHIRQGLFVVEKQIWYGDQTPGDTAGFAGLADDPLYNASDAANVVNAGGTTANTGSSVWLIRASGDYRHAAAVVGRNQNGATFDVKDTTVQKVQDGDGKWYDAYSTPVTGWVGAQFGTKYSAVRIANLTADAGKGLTDDLIAQALAKFPANEGPTFLAMNRRSLLQLQQSRTATNPTGAPAPFPTEAHGVPIQLTDSILSTEALLTAA